MHIVSDFFEIKLETSCPFTPKYFSMYFLSTKAFPYTNTLSIMTKIQTFNIAVGLLCNSQSTLRFHQLPSNVLYKYFHPHLLSPPGQEPVGIRHGIQRHALQWKAMVLFQQFAKSSLKTFLKNVNLGKQSNDPTFQE